LYSHPHCPVDVLPWAPTWHRRDRTKMSAQIRAVEKENAWVESGYDTWEFMQRLVGKDYQDPRP
jgi:hypothetical protein